MHLQAISFKIVSIKLNSHLHVTVSETFQLKAVPDTASVFPGFNSIPVESGNSYFWGLEENPYRRKDASQRMPYTAPSLPLRAVTVRDDQGHGGGSNQGQPEKKDPEGVLEKGTEVFS